MPSRNPAKPPKPPQPAKLRISLVSASLFVLFFDGCLPKPPAVVEKKTSEASKEVTSRPITVEGLIESAQKGDVAQVQRAIRQGINVDAQNAEGFTALMLAAFEGHPSVVEALLQAGATVDLTNSIQRTALMFASTSDSPETVEMLLKAGANVNAKDGHEAWTPLMFAASEGHIEVVKKILEYNPDLSHRELDGETALDFAVQRKHADVIELLQARMAKAERPKSETK